MSTRSTLFQTPTIEIDQSRYEELIQKELKYKQYKEQALIETIRIIEGRDSEIATTESEKQTMKVKAYAGDNLEMHHIEGTEKYGIKFSCILFDTYSEEESRLILRKLREIFTINLEE